MIAEGYPPSVVWKLTPRKIAAHLYFAAQRDKEERAELVSATRLAYHGTEEHMKAFNRKIENGV